MKLGRGREAANSISSDLSPRPTPPLLIILLSPSSSFPPSSFPCPKSQQSGYKATTIHFNGVDRSIEGWYSDNESGSFSKVLLVVLKGMASLGRTKISLPAQFSAAFSFPRKFAVCLSSSTRSSGVMFFGNGPYMLLPNTDASASLIYTPLIVNPVSTAGSYFQGEASSDYFIGVKSINISGKAVPNINASLLTIHQGNGGTKISTVNPYKVLETSIYKAVTEFFRAQLPRVPTVAAIAPFGLCFNSTNIGSTRVGPAVPSIDLVLQRESVYWRIFGSNSMVQVIVMWFCVWGLWMEV
ncbi:hypothetical protein RHMOL_Rhmol02G0022800 [Rhododendron molle]|uniref:Uncharacterized protein n=1 Tax=Rhododendron molle TaxID=49168 RepID=A0ACC0PKU5_RHOML|nr:hypothetical protein RHMOL_Rhmol02G0022800 [Rhododendron molle]